MTTFTPALWHSLNRLRNFRAHRIGETDQAEEIEIKVMLTGRPALPAKLCFGDGKNAQAVRRHGIDMLAQFAHCSASKWHKIGYGFGRAFGGDDVFVASR